MFKDLVVPLAGTPADADALKLALALAGSSSAHVTALEIVSLPMPVVAPWGMAPDLALGEAHEQLRARGQASAAALRRRLAGETASHEVMVVETLFAEPAQLAARVALLADLVVVGKALGDTAEGARTRAMIGSLLLESGRPVLVVPPGCAAPMPPRRLVLGWKSTPQASRAMHDALPLLRTAEAVDIVMVDAGGEARDTGDGNHAGADVLAHLARHGIKASVVLKDSGGRPASEILLEHLQQAEAQLLVVGGYGHTRLRQWALGGMTRELLFTAR
ncbi:MAG: hypothetical protein EOP92_38650, partial [Lysobacteraceae bacterium]